jgi:arylsulfatase A-like enzyme
MAVGRHGLQGKQNLYEHTWRVPFIVKGPGIRPGTRARGNIYLLDVLPTLCDLAGIAAPKTVEGVSFKPVLEGERETVRDVLYGVYCGGTKPGMRCVKQGDWKLIKYDVMDGTVRRTQLFNLKENPHEFLAEHERSALLETNLADDPKFAEKRREMETLLLSEMLRLDDPYRLWDHDHNHIHTREQLEAYDPHLAKLCEDVLGDSPWRFVSPRERAGTGHLAEFDPTRSPVAVDPKHIKDAANDYYNTYWKDYWQRLRDKHGIELESP